MNKTEEILKLKGLLDSGLINQSDFERLKKQIFEEPQKESIELDKITNSEFVENVQKKRIDISEESKTLKKCSQCGSDNEIQNSECSVCKTDFSIFESKVEIIKENKSNVLRYILISLFVILMLTSGIVYYMNTLKFKGSNELTDKNDSILAPNSSINNHENINNLTPIQTDTIVKSTSNESSDSNSPKLLRELESTNEKNMLFTQCLCGAHDCIIEFKDELGDLYEFMDSEITNISNYNFDCPSGTKYVNKVFVIKFKVKIYEYEDYPTETVNEIINISLKN